MSHNNPPTMRTGKMNKRMPTVIFLISNQMSCISIRMILKMKIFYLFFVQKQTLQTCHLDGLS